MTLTYRTIVTTHVLFSLAPGEPKIERTIEREGEREL